MWPRLVANKVFRKRTGSNSFVADFPCNSADTILQETSGKDVLHDQPNLNSKQIFNPHKDTHKYKYDINLYIIIIIIIMFLIIILLFWLSVFVSTWNVGGVEPHEDLKIEDWIDPSSDIYVLG